MKTPALLKRPRIIFTFCTLALATALSAKAAVWSSPEIVGRVLTTDGKPVEQAVVVANWEITASMNGASLGQLALVEVSTDRDGYFRIPAWGPRFALRGSIRDNQPMVRIFKAGYVPLILPNADIVGPWPAPMSIRYRFHDQTVQMQRFDGQAEQYEEALAPLVRSIEHIILYTPEGTCYWTQVPRLLLALQEQRRAMMVHGGGRLFRDAHQYAREADKAVCGDARKFFEKLQ